MVVLFLREYAVRSVVAVGVVNVNAYLLSKPNHFISKTGLEQEGEKIEHVPERAFVL